MGRRLQRFSEDIAKVTSRIDAMTTLRRSTNLLPESKMTWMEAPSSSLERKVLQIKNSKREQSEAVCKDQMENLEGTRLRFLWGYRCFFIYFPPVFSAIYFPRKEEPDMVK